MFEWLTGAVLYIFIACVLTFFTTAIIISVLVYTRYRYPFKVTVLENVAGTGLQPTIRDRAMLIRFGDGGEEIFYLQKRKKYRVGYGKRIGKNSIMWTIGADGFWYNSIFGDFDKKLMEVGVLPVDRDMRFSNSSLRKGIDNRYNEKTFFEKWGVAITIGILVVAILVNAGSQWFIFDKMKQVSSANAEGAKTSKEVMQLSKEVLSTVSTVKTGGTGFVSIPINST